MRLRGAAGRRIRDAASTGIQAAWDLHLSWPTVMDAFRAVAHEVTGAPLPEGRVLGIDEPRRGRPRWERDPATGKWRLTRDRWPTGFADAPGTGGQLGQVEGRTVADVLAWLAATSLTWRKSIEYMAIDMSTTYRAAGRTGLPQATVVVGHFHVVLVNGTPLSRLAVVQMDTVRWSCCQLSSRSSYGGAASGRNSTGFDCAFARRSDPGLPRFPALTLACTVAMRRRPS
ncbi:transposase [Streptomyces sp. NPDC008222]|uniref:transposase n=1 Tax=Streptomyces sp. NPDC008222 TaxID=3364820 RepID=UPI0036E9987D